MSNDLNAAAATPTTDTAHRSHDGVLRHLLLRGATGGGGARRRTKRTKKEVAPSKKTAEEAQRQVRRTTAAEVLEEAHSRTTALTATRVLPTAAGGRGLGAPGGHDAFDTGQGARLLRVAALAPVPETLRTIIHGRVDDHDVRRGVSRASRGQDDLRALPALWAAVRVIDA